MNNDFPRIITLLRKERGWSQKEAAAKLEVSQALLSHYENGKRECGLDFVIKAADIYRVSCDYLLGRTPERTGATIAITDTSLTGGDSLSGSRDLLLGKRLTINSLNVIFDLLMQVGNADISNNSIAILMTAVYRVLRILHTTSKSNPKNMFTIPSHNYCAITSGFSSLWEAEALHIARNPRMEAEEKMPVSVSPEKLSESYPLYAPSLLNLSSMIEEKFKSIQNSNKIF